MCGGMEFPLQHGRPRPDYNLLVYLYLLGQVFVQPIHHYDVSSAVHQRVHHVGDTLRRFQCSGRKQY